MIDHTRRRLIKAGIAGGALLAIAGGVAWFARSVMDKSAPRTLDPDASGIVRGALDSGA